MEQNQNIRREDTNDEYDPFNDFSGDEEALNALADLTGSQNQNEYNDNFNVNSQYQQYQQYQQQYNLEHGLEQEEAYHYQIQQNHEQFVQSQTQEDNNSNEIPFDDEEFFRYVDDRKKMSMEEAFRQIEYPPPHEDPTLWPPLSQTLHRLKLVVQTPTIEQFLCKSIIEPDNIRKQLSLTKTQQDWLYHEISVLFLSRPMISAAELSSQRISQGDRLSVGSQRLDEILKGGLRTHNITEISGESSVGKSQLCMQLLLQVQMPVDMGGLQGSAVYISTEGNVPTERISELGKHYSNRLNQFIQLVKSSNEPSTEYSEQADVSELVKNYGSITKQDLMDNIFIETCESAGMLRHIIYNSLPKFISQQLRPDKKPLRLVVVDSMAALYRSGIEYAKEESYERSKELFSLSNMLRRMSDFYGLCVVVVNQVSDYMKSNTTKFRLHSGPQNSIQRTMKGSMEMLSGLESNSRRKTPALGLAWTHCINTRILMLKSNSLPVEGPPSKIRRLDDQENPNYQLDETTNVTHSKKTMYVNFAPFTTPAACEYTISEKGVL